MEQVIGNRVHLEPTAYRERRTDTTERRLLLQLERASDI